MEPNPYDAPKEQGYLTHDEMAYWSWAKDRAMLWGCGFLVLIVGTILIGVVETAINWFLADA